jgi:hypothetical protein
MASLSNRIPKPPFFFRIFSPDGQGIMYKAAIKIDQDAYECPGSRQIGTTSDGIKIWLFCCDALGIYAPKRRQVNYTFIERRKLAIR